MVLRRLLELLPRRLHRQKILAALCRLRAIESIQLAEFNDGALAWVDLRDAESRAVYLSHSFWPEFPQMVAAFLGDGGDLFDVGANFGLVTFGALPLVARKEIGFHLFEANGRIIPTLKKSAALWPNERIVINYCCVSDVEGVSRLTLPDANWGHGHISERGMSVGNLLLDDYINEHGIERIAFLKMDVEGWEERALRGAQRSLSEGRVAVGFIEFVPEVLRSAGSDPNEVLRLLQAFGFDLYFCGMWDYSDPHNLIWSRASVNGTSLRFARAVPLPVTYVSGDLLIVHRTNRLAKTISSALTA